MPEPTQSEGTKEILGILSWFSDPDRPRNGFVRIVGHVVEDGGGLLWLVAPVALLLAATQTVSVFWIWVSFGFTCFLSLFLFTEGIVKARSRESIRANALREAEENETLSAAQTANIFKTWVPLHDALAKVVGKELGEDGNPLRDLWAGFVRELNVLVTFWHPPNRRP